MDEVSKVDATAKNSGSPDPKLLEKNYLQNHGVTIRRLVRRADGKSNVARSPCPGQTVRSVVKLADQLPHEVLQEIQKIATTNPTGGFKKVTLQLNANGRLVGPMMITKIGEKTDIPINALPQSAPRTYGAANSKIDKSKAKLNSSPIMLNSKGVTVLNNSPNQLSSDGKSVVITLPIISKEMESKNIEALDFKRTKRPTEDTSNQADIEPPAKKQTLSDKIIVSRRSSHSSNVISSCNMISVDISNGKLSNPNCPIKVLRRDENELSLGKKRSDNRIQSDQTVNTGKTPEKRRASCPAEVKLSLLSPVASQLPLLLDTEAPEALPKVSPEPSKIITEKEIPMSSAKNDVLDTSLICDEQLEFNSDENQSSKNSIDECLNTIHEDEELNDDAENNADNIKNIDDTSSDEDGASSVEIQLSFPGQDVPIEISDNESEKEDDSLQLISASPVSPTPVSPTPVSSTPVSPDPIPPLRVSPPPVSPSPVPPSPVSPTPVPSSSVSPSPVPPSPVSPSPVPPSPVSPSPATSSPVPRSPVSPLPASPSPKKDIPAEVGEKPRSNPTSYDEDPLDLLRWDDGIGSLYASNDIHFQFNEFGLVEVMDDKEFKRASQLRVDAFYDKPLLKRELDQTRSKRMVFATEPTYFCRGCCCNGTAADFLSPDFCSAACIQSVNASTRSFLKMSQRSTLQLSKAVPCGDSSISTPLDSITDDESSRGDGGSICESSPATDKISCIGVQSNPFVWANYLKMNNAVAAPVSNFINSKTPVSSSMFSVGMKLEAIDPRHNRLFCVCTIAECRGVRVRLHIDGASDEYDFWEYIYSENIFPAGWCRSEDQILEPPPNYENTFTWTLYLSKTYSIAAPQSAFKHTSPQAKRSLTSSFEIGVKLEAFDLKNTRIWRVATIANKLLNRVLVHFDNCDEKYDYWINAKSQHIRPVGWHKKTGVSLLPPNDCVGIFDWKEYLLETKSKFAKASMFTSRSKNVLPFNEGEKLEVVDKWMPRLIRPATVCTVSNGMIKLLFDGWPNTYAFWLDDDSPDLHPCNWCARTGHPIEYPGGTVPPDTECSFAICRGLGHARQPSIGFHQCLSDCPYEQDNMWAQEQNFADRLKQNRHNALSRDDIQDKTGMNDTERYKRLLASHKLITDYGPRIVKAHQLWTKNSKPITDRTEPILTNPMLWSIDKVADFITTIPNCESFRNLFSEQDIDGEALICLSQEDLVQKMNIRLGPAIKIYNQIIYLRETICLKFFKHT